MSSKENKNENNDIDIDNFVKKIMKAKRNKNIIENFFTERKIELEEWVRDRYGEQLDSDRKMEFLKPYYDDDVSKNSSDDLDARIDYISDWMTNYNYDYEYDYEMMVDSDDPDNFMGWFHSKKEIEKFYLGK